MNNMKLGRLEKLNLRDYWKNEATGFTHWLVEGGNIQLLSDAIGIKLKVQNREVSVGDFRADILCKDTNGRNVIIENQLEVTKHDHLGQLMTYAAGRDAVTIIWIAEEFRDEHRAALDWLNRITDDTFNIFGIQIEVYKIENSIGAPMFNIVSKPNNWTKQIKESTPSQVVTEITLLQQEYWQGLKDFMDKNSDVTMQDPPLKYSTKMSIGHSYIHLFASVNSSNNSISISLNFTGDQAKDNYDNLYKISYENSFTEISPDLEWDKMEGKRMSAVTLKKSADYLDEADWPKQFEWFKKYLEKYMNYFKEKITKIKK